MSMPATRTANGWTGLRDNDAHADPASLSTPATRSADQFADHSYWSADWLVTLRRLALANERQALASALVAASTERLQGFTFRHAPYRAVLDAMRQLESRDERPELVEVWKELVASRQAHLVGGPAYLAALADGAEWVGFEAEPAKVAAEYWQRYDAAAEHIEQAEAIATGSAGGPRG